VPVPSGKSFPASRNKPDPVICEEVEGEALATPWSNQNQAARQTNLKCAAVKAPGQAARRKAHASRHRGADRPWPAISEDPAFSL